MTEALKTEFFCRRQKQLCPQMNSSWQVWIIRFLLVNKPVTYWIVVCRPQRCVGWICIVTRVALLHRHYPDSISNMHIEGNRMHPGLGGITAVIGFLIPPKPPHIQPFNITRLDASVGIQTLKSRYILLVLHSRKPHSHCVWIYSGHSGFNWFRCHISTYYYQNYHRSHRAMHPNFSVQRF